MMKRFNAHRGVYMREIDLATLMREIVLQRNASSCGPSLQLSMPLNLSPFLWFDHRLETLIERFINSATSICYPARAVRIAVNQKAKLTDLEKFFGIYPSHWIELRFEAQGPAGFEEGARKIFEDLGYRCEEWVGVENSGQQLASFCLGTERGPKLVFWVNNQRSIRKCDLLIPITKPAV